MFNSRSHELLEWYKSEHTRYSPELVLSARHWRHEPRSSLDPGLVREELAVACFERGLALTSKGVLACI
jgi:hypothetical protein